MQWEIHNDGSFDLVAGFGAVRGMWPGIDHQDIRCRTVAGEGGRIGYALDEGELHVELGEWEHGLSVGCELRGVRGAPHWLHPMHGGRVEGLGRLFRQGIGFSGPTNLVDIGESRECWSYESYLLAGLLDDDERTLVIAPHQHHAFLFKAQVYNRLFRHNFRNREIEQSLSLFEAGFRTERLVVADTLVLPTLYISEGQGLFDTLRGATQEIARANGIACDKPPRYHYCSAYYHGPNFNRALLDNVLDGMEKVDPVHRVQTVQIDDWYMTSRGDWLTFKQHLWPGGLKPAFERIENAGYTPGVWVAPFMVGSSSKLAREHPDWLLHGADGERVVEWKHYNADASPDFEHYVLDTSHPEAMAWVREVFATFRRWGVRFFKTDFLEWGYRDSTQVARFAPGKTGARYFDDVMRTIREAIGPESYWLGCITYFAPSIGYMDGMRVSSDVGNQWAAVGGIGYDGVGGEIPNMLQETFATLYMNHVLWQNDPDVVFVRNRHSHLSDVEFCGLAAWHALLGHSVNTSDTFGELSAERLAWWRWMRPREVPWTAHLPYFGTNHPFRVVVRDYADANGWALLVLNDRGERGMAVLPVHELTGRHQAVVYRWSPAGAEKMGEWEELRVELEPHHSVLLFVSRDGEAPPEELNLGGSWGL